MISATVVDQTVNAAFKRLVQNSQHPEPATAAIASRMLAAVEDNFRAEGRPTRWKELKPSTKAARAAAGQAGKILQASGKLAASITPFHSRDEAGVGTNKPYAAAQNFGSKPHDILPRTKKALAFGGGVYRRVKHPGTVAREFMVLTDGDKADLVEIMGMHLTSGI